MSLHRFPFTDLQVALENLFFKLTEQRTKLTIDQQPVTHSYSKILLLNLSTYFSFPFVFLLCKIESFSSYIIIFNHTFILLLAFTLNSLQF